MFELTGLPPAPRGVPQIEVAFDIDANGIMHVSAKDLGTGREQKMTVTGGSALPKNDIDRMVREAEQHAEEDRRRREGAETRNQAEQLVYSTEKLIRENPERISAEARQETEAALTELKAKLKDENADTAAIRQATDRVAQSAQKIGTALYEQSRAEGQTATGASGPGDSGGSASGGPADDEVVDAEIVDDDKPEAG
ncbi:Chaperone protein DnaK [Streptomyces sp. F-1]|nr:Chaperone protein DnaK [Streptomyces sp. F-1]